MINKESKQVRVVMDPDGKNMIATSTNDGAGQGGILFDAGSERFLDSSADKYDNLTYIENSAAWLEENNYSSGKRSVLIYDTDTQAGLGNHAFSKNAVAALEKKGFLVAQTTRRKTPELSGRLLDHYGQVWIFCGESNSAQRFSTAELQDLSAFADKGKSMLIVAGNPRGGVQGLAAANQLSSRYGVTFSGSVKHEEEITVSTASHFLHRAAEALGWFLKLVHKA